MRNKFLSISMLTLLVSGCTSLDGLNGKSNFDCKAPDGVVCDSMTGVMANAKANNLPGQQVSRSASKTPVRGSEFTSVASREARVMTTMEYTGAPILRNPKTLRIWVAPWEGADRTLYDQQFFYMVIDNWKWNIEHNSRRVRQAYAPGTTTGYVSAPTQNQTPKAIETDAIQMKVDGNAVVPDDSASPINSAKVGTIDPLAGKSNIDAGVTRELQNMNIDISQFTKPLAKAQ